MVWDWAQGTMRTIRDRARARRGLFMSEMRLHSPAARCELALSGDLSGFDDLSEGELDFEGAAFVGLAGDLDAAVMFVDDAAD